MDVTEDYAQDGLTVARRAAHLSGTFEYANGLDISFDTRADGPVSNLHLGVGRKPFDVSTNFLTGDITIDGHGAMLTPGELEALRVFTERLGSWLEQRGTYVHEQLAVNAANYFSEASPTYVHDWSVHTAEAKATWSTGNNGSTCLNKWWGYYAYFDLGSSGSVRSAVVVAASNWGTNVCGGGWYDCMGRCGAGCGSVQNYTLDCLEHDYCSHEMCAADGPDSYNCGDEYWNAADDFLSRWCG